MNPTLLERGTRNAERGTKNGLSLRTPSSRLRVRAGWALLGLVLLLNSGCLGAAIVAGGAAAAGAGAGTYFWVRAPLYLDYSVDLQRAYLAVQAAMTEMKLPVLRRDLAPEQGKITLETRLADGTTTTIYLTTMGKPIPADGIVTRIAVRVGLFNRDEESAKRILDDIGKYLAPPGPVPIPSAPISAAPPPAVPTNGPLRPVAVTSQPETGPPPLQTLQK